MPYVVSDETRVRQIVTNLLTNAIKFTPPGGLISIIANMTDKESVIVVTDNGMGMSPDELEHVFDAFWQADSSSTKQYQGVGLGLAICKKMVQAIGGRIWIASAKGAGKGTTVSFTVPNYSNGKTEDPEGAGPSAKDAAR